MKYTRLDHFDDNGKEKIYSRLLLGDYWDNIADLKVQTLQTPEIWNVEGQRVAKQARGSQGSPDGGQSLA